LYTSIQISLKIVTVALMQSSYINTEMLFRGPENCLSVSDVIFISGGKLFHSNGAVIEKLRGLKPAVLDFWFTAHPGHPHLPSANGSV